MEAFIITFAAHGKRDARLVMEVLTTPEAEALAGDPAETTANRQSERMWTLPACPA